MPYVPTSFFATRIGRIMAAHGEACTLQRDGKTDLAVRGVRSMRTRTAGGEVANSFDGTNLYFVIGNAELEAAGWGTPLRTDTIKGADGHAYVITHVDTRADGSGALVHNLWVDG
jgi:hypothetical protein